METFHTTSESIIAIRSRESGHKEGLGVLLQPLSVLLFRYQKSKTFAKKFFGKCSSGFYRSFWEKILPVSYIGSEGEASRELSLKCHLFVIKFPCLIVFLTVVEVCGSKNPSALRNGTLFLVPPHDIFSIPGNVLYSGRISALLFNDFQICENISGLVFCLIEIELELKFGNVWGGEGKCSKNGRIRLCVIVKKDDQAAVITSN